MPAEPKISVTTNRKIGMTFVPDSHIISYQIGVSPVFDRMPISWTTFSGTQSIILTVPASAAGHVYIREITTADGYAPDPEVFIRPTTYIGVLQPVLNNTPTEFYINTVKDYEYPIIYNDVNSHINLVTIRQGDSEYKLASGERCILTYDQTNSLTLTCTFEYEVAEADVDTGYYCSELKGAHTFIIEFDESSSTTPVCFLSNVIFVENKSLQSTRYLVKDSKSGDKYLSISELSSGECNYFETGRDIRNIFGVPNWGDIPFYDKTTLDGHMFSGLYPAIKPWNKTCDWLNDEFNKFRNEQGFYAQPIARGSMPKPFTITRTYTEETVQTSTKISSGCNEPFGSIGITDICDAVYIYGATDDNGNKYIKIKKSRQYSRISIEYFALTSPLIIDDEPFSANTAPFTAIGYVPEVFTLILTGAGGSGAAGYTSSTGSVFNAGGGGGAGGMFVFAVEPFLLSEQNKLKITLGKGYAGGSNIGVAGTDGDDSTLVCSGQTWIARGGKGGKSRIEHPGLMNNGGTGGILEVPTVSINPVKLIAKAIGGSGGAGGSEYMAQNSGHATNITIDMYRNNFSKFTLNVASSLGFDDSYNGGCGGSSVSLGGHGGGCYGHDHYTDEPTKGHFGAGGGGGAMNGFYSDRYSSGSAGAGGGFMLLY